MIAPFEPGSRIADRYRIEASLGAGGMGTVVRAFDERLGRAVAIKVLRPELGEDIDAITRFEREAVASAQLSHPGIVVLHDSGSVAASGGRGRLSYLVMEHVEGVTLERVLAAGPLAPDRAADVVLQALGALSVAHAAGIVHRDLKPANLMLTRDGAGREVVKLLDFGLAQLKAGSAYTRMTQTGAILGTPLFMAPEQARAQPCDARTDVYAMGLVLWSCLTGRRPYAADDLAALMVAVLEQMPPRADAVAHGVSPELAVVAERAMKKRPEDRYASAAAFAAAIASAQTSMPAFVATAVFQSSTQSPSPLAPPAVVSGVTSRAVPPRTAAPSGRGVLLAVASLLASLALLGAVVLGATIAHERGLFAPPAAAPAPALAPAPAPAPAPALAPAPAPAAALAPDGSSRPWLEHVALCCSLFSSDLAACRSQFEQVSASSPLSDEALFGSTIDSYHHALEGRGQDASRCARP